MFCLVYLQHHKDQLEVVIWVKDHFKKCLCQKINILAFFTKTVPLNSQAFLDIRICDKNNLSTQAHHSRQSEEPKKNSVGIFEYILASMLKVFLNMLENTLGWMPSLKMTQSLRIRSKVN